MSDEAIAWSVVIRLYRDSGTSVRMFCRDNVMAVCNRRVTARMLRRALEREEKYGVAGNVDRRTFNSGDLSVLSPLLRSILLGHYLLYPQQTTASHRRYLLKVLTGELPDPCVGSTQLYTVDEYKSMHQPSRWLIQRFFKDLPRYIKVFAEEGQRGLNEKFGFLEARPLYTPEQLFVMDTVEFKEFQFKRNGKPSNRCCTYIADAASGNCIWAITHWKNPSSREILLLLQKAFLPERRERRSDAWVENGCPKYLLRDHGAAFDNEVFERALDAMGIVPLFSHPYCPRENGKAENFAKIVRSWIIPILIDKIYAHRLAVPNGVSDKLKMFEDTFLGLIEEVNMTARRNLGDIPPLQHYETHRLPQPLNPVSRETIIKATLVTEKDIKPNQGTVAYKEQVYSCKDLDPCDERLVTVWADPYEPHPKTVLVERDGVILGSASRENDRRKADLSEFFPSQSLHQKKSSKKTVRYPKQGRIDQKAEVSPLVHVGDICPKEETLPKVTKILELME